MVGKDLNRRKDSFRLVVSVTVINTLWTGDADLRLYITTVQDG